MEEEMMTCQCDHKRVFLVKEHSILMGPGGILFIHTRTLLLSSIRLFLQ